MGKITARGDTQREILARSRLFIGYQSVGVKKEVSHSCFKCNTLEHQIAECKVESATCGGVQSAGPCLCKLQEASTLQEFQKVGSPTMESRGRSAH